MLFSVIILFAISLVSAGKQASRPAANAAAVVPQSAQHKKCSRELEQIIYSPPSAARDYLLNIVREVSIALLSTSGGGLGDTRTLGLVLTLANSYNVSIEFQPTFSSQPNVVFNPKSSPTVAPRIFGSLIPPTYLNQPGFVYDSDSRTYSVAVFTQSSSTAIGTTVIVSASADSRTFFDC